MEKIIAGRHLTISENLKEFINNELRKIENEYNKLTTARVVLDHQKNWKYTEIILNGKNINIEANARSKDMRKAITNAVAKTRKQLKRYLDKVQDHHARKEVNFG